MPLYQSIIDSPSSIAYHEPRSSHPIPASINALSRCTLIPVLPDELQIYAQHRTIRFYKKEALTDGFCADELASAYAGLSPKVVI